MSRQLHNRSKLSVALSLIWTEMRYSPRAFLLEFGLPIPLLILVMLANYYSSKDSSVLLISLMMLVAGPAIFGGMSNLETQEGRLHLMRQLPVSTVALILQRFLRSFISATPYIIAVPIWMLYLDKWGYPFSGMAVVNIMLMILLFSTFSTWFRTPIKKSEELGIASIEVIIRAVIAAFVATWMLDTAVHHSQDHGSWGYLTHAGTAIPLIIGIVILIPLAVSLNRERIIE